jgi:hypothetical protein
MPSQPPGLTTDSSRIVSASGLTLQEVLAIRLSVTRDTRPRAETIRDDACGVSRVGETIREGRCWAVGGR